MYFEIDNTPEHIKKARKIKKKLEAEVPKEECPRLILAPFSRPPQVVFDNVIVGTTVEKQLEILNPLKTVQQITLGRALPPGLIIHLPSEWLVLEPETCYTLTLQWTALQPTALRETIRFTNDSRGRHDVIVVLKSIILQQAKPSKVKGYKVSPRKNKSKNATKRSPVSIYKKKQASLRQTTNIKQTFEYVSSVQYKMVKSSNKENEDTVNNSTLSSRSNRCPFDSPFICFDTSEVFSNLRSNNLQATYDKDKTPEKINKDLFDHGNILKPSNKQDFDSDIFDKLTFTPLKSIPQRKENLNKGPKVVISVQSGSDTYECLEETCKENVTHSIICIESVQETPKYSKPTENNSLHEVKHVESEIVQSKKIPNTSSPKELDSLNFTMNTEFSRISNDISFYPQRFSTEKKMHPVKISSENFHELTDDLDPNGKFSSDTYTKSVSPKTTYSSMDYNIANAPLCAKAPKSKHALFKETCHYKDMYDTNYLKQEMNPWHFDKSPPRSMTPPPLHVIPEENSQNSETRLFDKSDKQTTFTINQTSDKWDDNKSIMSRTEFWSKKSVKCEPELWKVPTAPPKKSLSSKCATLKKRVSVNSTFDISMQQNSLNHSQIENVYSQSFTVDPFLSSTYFYDEGAVHKFENEFKRWLNYILTPPADLDSNIDNKIDFGKAWIENRNKEVPAAPTKEQVCSKYHNSNRLERVRKAARDLLLSPELSQVFQKLNAQIEKKLIAIRNDKNLHLDVGLQKIIMEILLSYNPLWLRIGLEAIYGIVLPLKSNSDIEGLTTFIIQRLFKNPFLKNKNLKSSAPNMLLPAYIEAVKKYTLKRFFMLVFFLDRAKQKRLISHDPCLFCRNALCKESKEILIKFTRELIAGIGDITKHLRPLGYLVYHKQSYLDEYKYAVHNIAADIRDGVRLTKVMEIILMKNGLLTQLRTPAISRLQKIHNVQVALSALKEAKFVIVGDISAQDIADGHREKTLSLLWQIIHVFRAPLFEKAANIIKTWWKKKYEIIVAEKKIKEEIQLRRHNAASVVQRWWRLLQYNREVELKTQQLTAATIVLQKYWRMWICRRRLWSLKISVTTIERWWRGVTLVKKAKRSLAALKHERENLRNASATLIQSHIRRWLCIHRMKVANKCARIIQNWWRQIQYERELAFQRQQLIAATVVFQKNWRMRMCRIKLQTLKKSVLNIEKWWRGIILVRDAKRSLAILQVEREQLRQRSATLLQSHVRRWICVHKFKVVSKSIVTIQRRWRQIRYNRKVELQREKLIAATIVVQKYWRMKVCSRQYQKLKMCVLKIENWWTGITLLREAKKALVSLQLEREELRKKSATLIQSQVRRWICTQKFKVVCKSTVTIQRWWRQIQYNREVEFKRQQLIAATIVIQKYWRMKVCTHQLRTQRNSVIKIKSWWRGITLVRQAQRSLNILRLERETLRNNSATLIQSHVKRWLCMRKFKAVSKSVIVIQNWWRVIQYNRRIEFERLQRIAAAVILQKNLRMWLHRRRLQRLKHSVSKIEIWWKGITLVRDAKQSLDLLRKDRKELRNRSATLIQTHVRRWLCVRKFKVINKSVITIQRWWRQNQYRCEMRLKMQQLIAAIVILQKNCRMWIQRHSLQRLKNSVLAIETWWRGKTLVKEAKKSLVDLRFKREELRNKSATLIQSHIKCWLCLRKFKITVQKVIIAQSVARRFIERRKYLQIKHAVLSIQYAYKWAKLREQIRLRKQDRLDNAAITIQKYVRRYIAKSHYEVYQKRVIYIQRIWRSKLITRLFRCEFLQKKQLVIRLQSVMRGYLVRKECLVKREQLRKNLQEKRMHWAASKIQALFRGHMARARCEESPVERLRRRWRDGGLQSTQPTIGESSRKALDTIENMYDIYAVIKAFQLIERLTEVNPQKYQDTASWIADRVYMCMTVTNRSTSSVRLLTSSAEVLVNLTRYPPTAPYMYQKEIINEFLKLMMRFCTSEPQLFCVLCTYIWLFSKYDDIREDLTEHLQLPDNHKLVVAMRANVERMQRMNKQKLFTPQAKGKMRQSSLNYSLMTNTSQALNSSALPALKPDFGLGRGDRPKHFQDPYKAMQCLVKTYKL